MRKPEYYTRSRHGFGYIHTTSTTVLAIYLASLLDLAREVEPN